MPSPVLRGIQSDTGAGDATADYQNVESLVVCHGFQRLLTLLEGKL